MKHHFADFLDREGDYWTVIPNMKRYAYSADKKIKDTEKVKILTISKYDKNWKQVFDCQNIEEITLHEPSKEQVASISILTDIVRLRVTHLRTKDIDFISTLENLEELILEYVSGFSDLAPLRKLPKLKSLHFENLRGVANFDGLKGLASLRYLHIDGTLDWNQPIKNFDFLTGLPNLEVFSLGLITNKSEFPAFLPVLKLKKLKKINIVRSTFQTKEYAFLEAAIPKVDGCSWDLCWKYGDNYQFLGKQAGRVNINNPNVRKKCDEFIQSYERMKAESKKVIERYRVKNKLQ
jgi:hypothetical protein